MAPPGFIERALASTRNVLDLMRAGRLGDPYGAPYEVVDQGPHHRLRRYATAPNQNGPVVLLVPPLMVTSEVYDIDETLSAVAFLERAGITPFIVDFGAPEREVGGITRTLDDHVLAAARCVERVHALTQRHVHLAGYSQGGMFAYQTAAFLRSEAIASVITFGSPVDLHKSLPAVHAEATGALLRILDPITSQVFARIEALPGALTSTGFKLLSGRKEIAQRLEFLASLHDRQALVRREARRAFLGGEGFVAWPGPAFRTFVDQFIVHNRMLSGGFVLDGRTVSLADIRVPVLAFVGDHDDLARPAAVHAIKHAAPHATIRFVHVKAGHFGLVVGSTAMRETWPTTAAWIHDPIRAVAAPPASRAYEPDEAAFSFDLGNEMLDAITTLGRTAWRRIGELAASASDAYDGLRYQEPRLRALAAMTDDTRMSASRMLTDRARETPNATCFLWRGRAFTYAVAQRRVDDVVRGLWSCGVRPGWRVGVWMHSRPSLLTALTALMRLGAVAVLAPPESNSEVLRTALHEAQARAVVCDIDHVVRAHACGLATWVLGGGDRTVLPSGVVDMERIDPSQIVVPPDVALDAARAGDLALLLARPDGTSLRLVSVTHRRHLLSALGAAAACTLTPDDTVYCCLPLHHPTGVLVGVGAALAGGARLALGERFDPELFFTEVRRYGATVAFYAGEMLRALVHTPPSRGDRAHSLRLVAGSGMRADLWSKVSTRFGVGVMEFYASTSHRVVVANASGAKVGAIGRQLPGSAPFMVARVDFATRSVARDDDASPVRADIGEAGVLLARDGAEWHTLDAVVRVDEDGDLWLLDTLGGYVWTRRGPVSTRAVEDALYTLPEVELAAAWGEGSAGEANIVAAIATRTDLTPERIAGCLETMAPEARPLRVLQRRTLPMTDGFRPDRRAIRGI